VLRLADSNAARGHLHDGEQEQQNTCAGERDCHRQKRDERQRMHLPQRRDLNDQPERDQNARPPQPRFERVVAHGA
jgi:hypothetical protein